MKLVNEVVSNAEDGGVSLGEYNGHPVSRAAAIAIIGELGVYKPHEQPHGLGNMVKKVVSIAVEEIGVKAQVGMFDSIFVICLADNSMSN